MPSRIYRNLIHGEQRIHVELTAHDILDLLDDEFDPRLPAGRQLLRILTESADAFGLASSGLEPGDCTGHADCMRCDVTDPCPCCGQHYVGAGRWAPALKLCGAQHGRWPETVCTERAGHGAEAPHAGPIVVDGRRIDGGVAWGGSDARTSSRTETGPTIHNPQASIPTAVDNPADTSPVPVDLRGGFWPNMTGGMCARCHLALIRGEEIDPEHPVCLVINDGMRISETGPGEVTLHLPEWRVWDTQATAAEVGIPASHLPALKAVLDAHLAQQALAGPAFTEGTTS